MGFEPFKIEPGIWSRPCGEDHYDHIDVCADVLIVAFKDLWSAPDMLNNKRSFKLKGGVTISYGLGFEFVPNDDGALWF